MRIEHEPNEGNVSQRVGQLLCDRCRDTIAAVSCLACGGSNLEVMRFCHECDKVVHQIIYKQSHVRSKIGVQAVPSEVQAHHYSSVKNPNRESQQKLVPREEPMRCNDYSYKHL